jgi:hypothetical protein
VAVGVSVNAGGIAWITVLHMPGHVPPGFEQVVGHFIGGVGVGVGPPADGGGGIVTVTAVSSTGAGVGIDNGVASGSGTAS